ncbi:DUF6744 family protein [Lysinibacillus sphaericus]|uniref:DUF6744 family protein n=1 Tax=Lysinibacillus sphaericus TaxID=1421 RepID=UPI003F79C3E1
MENRKQVLGKGVVTQNVGAGSELLGYIVSYSVGEALYRRDEMEKSLVDNGLDVNYLPKPVDPKDAFARAARECEIKSWKPTAESKEYKNFTVRDVVRAGQKRVKNIVVETVNAEREQLDYDSEGAILSYEVKTGVMTTVWNDPTCMDLVNHAESVFQEYLSTHNGNTVRGSITKLFNSMSPILMRATGGVYFVPVQYEDKLTSAVTYINSLEKGDAFCIPLVNNSEGQALIKLKVQEHLQGVLNKCRDAIKANEDLTLMPEKKRKEFEKDALATALQAVEQFKDYKAILSGEINQVEGAFDLVKAAIKKMTEELLIKPVKKREK